ncbi:alkaline phosphatase family protein [Brevundimonas sp.]|uniref:alkaline phosphatase family protein n=1 Tax=Brevundimonas sp. TaxID=1871086 RepID=UPI003D12BF72
MIRLVTATAVALITSLWACAPAWAQDDQKVILVTVDGLRWQEVFHGAEARLIDDESVTDEPDDIRARYLEPADPAAALMPFLNGPMASQGVLAGDRLAGSCMRVTNPHWFSYPGYNEILTGRADPAIDSNDKRLNPNVTVLETVNRLDGFRGRVRAFGSWDVFPFIINTERSGVPVNAGYSPLPDDGRPETAMLNSLMMTTPRQWAGVRLDAFTHQAALLSLKHDKPRLLYVAYGETDDFAHDADYDAYLTSAERTDAFIAELWRTAQSDPFYAGKTTLIVTTDHGRGSRQRRAWTAHGSSETAWDRLTGQDWGRGSDQTWIGLIGPHIQVGASPAPGQCWGADQIAATILGALDLTGEGLMPMASVAFPGVLNSPT